MTGENPTVRQKDRPSLGLKGLGFILLTLGLSYLAAYQPPDPGPSRCLSKGYLGFSCPLCGMTRSLRAATDGRIGEAFRWHVFGPPLLAVAIAAWAGLGWGLVRRRRCFPETCPRLWTWMAIGSLPALLCYWGIRVFAQAVP
jgi:hypothetical protein